MSDFDAQRLLNIIDERIRQHLDAGLSYHHGVVASVSTSPQTCTVYLYGSTDTSGGFFWSPECYPEVGDTVRVAINRKTGDRWVDAVVSRPDIVTPTEVFAPAARSYARYNRTTAQSISFNTDTIAVYNSLVFSSVNDSDWSYNTGTGVFTIGNDGYYLVVAGWLWDSNASTNVRQLSIFQNGATVAAHRVTVGNDTIGLNVSAILHASATDTIDARVRHGISSTSLSNSTGAGAERSFISMARIA